MISVYSIRQTVLDQKTEKKNAIFLMGPTAAGKTELAFALANHLPIEIISVDSAMIYRGMDIGTGKPTAAELATVPHHLIDIFDPSESYSAAEFAKDALRHMHTITDRGRIPLLVGGTMLYFRALQQGLSPLPSASPIIRAKLLGEAERLGWGALHERLASIDPIAALRINPNDSQRIQRALEVYEVSGKTLSAFLGEKPTIDTGLQDYQIHAFAITPAVRAELHQRIEQRFHKMLDQGLITEVKNLFLRGDLDLNMPSMRAVGYRQIWQHLAGDYGYNEMIEKALAATRQLAKRQLTWLRNLNDIKKITMNHLASVKTVIHCLSSGESRRKPQ